MTLKMERVKEIFNVKELKDLNLWKAVLAEFLGTAFLVLVGCGSVTGGKDENISFIEISFSFGLTVAIMVQSFAHISGGHINPAVTAGLIITRHCPIIRGILYVIAQLIGAIIGALILASLLPSSLQKSLGNTNIHPELSLAQAFGIEFLITFVLVFVVCSVVDVKRIDNKGSGPLIIGLSVAACHLWAIKYTGSSMNTARSFGPAVVGNNWGNHWIYWVGPIPGGIAAGLMYKFLFSAKDIDPIEMSRQEVREV